MTRSILVVLLLSLVASGQVHVGVNVRDQFGAKGDGLANDTAAFVAALNQAAKSDGQVFCPSGVYVVDPIVITATMANTELYGAVRTSYDSSDACVLKAKGVGPIIAESVPNIRKVAVRNIVFNGNAMATVGIDLDTTIAWALEGNYFYNFPAGSVAAKGGGNLFLSYEHNSNSVSGMAVDMQDLYSSVAASTYYGCNFCTFSNNSFSASQGVRASGNVSFIGNDFELTLNSPALAALDISDPNNSSFAQVKNNYFELSSGTATKLRAIYLGTSNSVEITGNEIYGASQSTGGSTAIEAQSYVLAANIQANKIHRWEAGIKPGITPSGVYSQVVSGNYFRDTATDVPDPAMTMGQSSGAALGSRIHSSSNGFFFVNRAMRPMNCDIVAGDTTLDLALCNAFYVNQSPGSLLRRVRNVVPGSFFYVTTANSNTTFSNSAFHLCRDSDYTPAANRPMLFIVDSTSTIREVCGSQ